MDTKEYHTEDKSGWPEGVWKTEPDKLQWPDPHTGLPCLIVRGPTGALCGYVGVPNTHPWHGKSHGDEIGDCIESCDGHQHFGHTISTYINVHGGLTFSDACAHEDDESIRICHIPGPGESDNVWWFGFDCAHAWDICPKYLKYFENFSFSDWGTYKDIAYVRDEVTRLAQQLAGRK